MKKVFMSLLIGSLFVLLPFKANAMLEVDENGNPIQKELQEGEATILIAPSPDTATSSDGTNVSSSDEREQITNDSTNGEITKGEKTVYEALDAEATLLDKEATTDKDNNVVYVIISGLAGAIVGSAITYLLKK
jgi:hypothetical protein